MSTLSTNALSVGKQPASADIASFSSTATQRPDLWVTSVGLTTCEIYESLFPRSEQEIAKCYKIMVWENFSVRDLMKYGLIARGYAMEPALFENALSLPLRSWIELVQSSYSDVDVKQVVESGVRLLAQLNGPDKWPAQEWSQPQFPNIHANNIALTTMSCLSAQLANAIQLNYAPEDLLPYNAQSRFYIPGWENSEFDSSANIRNEQLECFPLDLVPTSAQRRFPHHPAIDLIPWPSFRSKFITATATNPPMFDEDDAYLDMISGGLRCWTSVKGNGISPPSDSRSWEAMPWFIEKWAVLMDGPDGEISRTSAWWRRMQGS